MNIVVCALFICGLVFFTGGAVGIIRLPDFYSRLHPAGKLDTAGLVTAMGALALHTAFSVIFRLSAYRNENRPDCRVRVHHQPHCNPCHYRCRRQGRLESMEKGVANKRMIWQIEFIILLIVIVCGIAALTLKDLLGASILFGAYSFMMCLLWAIMGAVDVSFTEASVGAGISTVLFVAAVFQTSRRSKD